MEESCGRYYRWIWQHQEVGVQWGKVSAVTLRSTTRCNNENSWYRHSFLSSCNWGCIRCRDFTLATFQICKLYIDLERYFRKYNQQISNCDLHVSLPENAVVIKNVRYLAHELFGYDFILIRNGENISCKVGWILTSFGNWFWDLWERRFPVFKIDRHCKNILLPSNNIHEGSIVTNNDGAWKTSFNIPLLIKKPKDWMKQFYFK